MKLQFDTSTRVVSLENLKAMCKRVSGTCHRFEVVRASTSRVQVEYSNPDEYAVEHPIRAYFPCYVFGHAGEKTVAVILEIVGVSTRADEAWQAFHVLLDCPVLWRSPETNEWLTEDEIKARQAVK